VSASAVFVLPDSSDICYKLNNTYHYIEASNIMSLKYVIIVGANKSRQASKRDGIYTNVLNHFKRPKDSELQRFCQTLMLQLPLYNRGNNPIGKQPIQVPRQIQVKIVKDFKDIHFVKEEVPLMEYQRKIEIEDKIQQLQVDVNGSLNNMLGLVDDSEKEEEIAVDVGDEADNDNDDDDEEEDSFNKIDTQAVVHHSHSSVEDLDDIVVNDRTDDDSDNEDNSGLVTQHISC